MKKNSALNGIIATILISMLSVTQTNQLQAQSNTEANTSNRNQIDPQLETTRSTSIHTFRRPIEIAGDKLELEIDTLLYNHGSFRQVESIQGYRLVNKSEKPLIAIEEATLSIWPEGERLPAIRILYAYTASLTVSIDQHQEKTIGNELEKAGFLHQYTENNRSFYRMILSQNGSFRLYQ